MPTHAPSIHPGQLLDDVRRLWDLGWHPLDVVRVAGDNKRLCRLFADVVSVDRAGWHREAATLWTDQADQIGAHTTIWWNPDDDYARQWCDRHRCDTRRMEQEWQHLRLLLGNVPPQPVLAPPPSQPDHTRGAVDDRMLAKVRALLAKAESSTFEEEAQALSAKAQELIARHAIDVALLAADVDVPGGRRIYIDPPYPKPKFLLLSSVAAANDCRAVWNDGRKTATVFGHQHDLHLTEVLFTSLLVQGTGAVLQAGSRSDAWGGSSTRSWRNAFWVGYADRVGERLQAATDSTRAAASATNADLLPVLASRALAVDEALAEAFPKLGSFGVSLSNGAGLHAGRAFAERAELSADHTMGTRTRHALPRG